MNEIRRIRLFTDKKLILGGKAELSEKASHYLCNVMRCNAGEKIRCFNETDGEFLCRIEVSDKKKTIVRIEELLRLREKDNDIWLLFAPLKKDQTDFVIAKAVELGVSKIIPIITERTNSERVKVERFAAQAVEAAEQCGRLSVPEVVSPVKLIEFLGAWNPERLLFFADERRRGKEAADAFRQSAGNPAAILVGPEGGFSDEEAARLDKCLFVKNINLGPRILRAETAAVASLSVWQASAGDWRNYGERT